METTYIFKRMERKYLVDEVTKKRLLQRMQDRLPWDAPAARGTGDHGDEARRRHADIICAGAERTEQMCALHITAPEPLPFAGARCTDSHRLAKTRAPHMGSFYKLTYDVELKPPHATQCFLDELRCRNGNPEILLTEKRKGADAL